MGFIDGTDLEIPFPSSRHSNKHVTQGNVMLYPPSPACPCALFACLCLFTFVYLLCMGLLPIQQGVVSLLLLNLPCRQILLSGDVISDGDLQHCSCMHCYSRLDIHIGHATYKRGCQRGFVCFHTYRQSRPRLPPPAPWLPASPPVTWPLPDLTFLTEAIWSWSSLALMAAIPLADIIRSCFSASKIVVSWSPGKPSISSSGSPNSTDESSSALEPARQWKTQHSTKCLKCCSFNSCR